MSVCLAFIGLDRTGVSAAMALSARPADIYCKGWDPDHEKCVAAAELKLFHPVCRDLQEALKNATLVCISLPPEDLRNILKEIGDFIESETVLVVFSRQHSLILEWTQEVLGENTRVISMLPSLNPAFVCETGTDMESPRADLFTNAPFYITVLPGATEENLTLASDLAILLGGNPIFADAPEVDGLIAANLLLPELTAAELMALAGAQPGWHEGQRMAGSSLAGATAALGNLSAEESAQWMLANRENLIRLLDEQMNHLQQIEEMIQKKDGAALQNLLENGCKVRQEWLNGRLKLAGKREDGAALKAEKEALDRFVKLGK